MTRISFLLPTFNRAHFVAETIGSITQQMSSEDELIVINDGSSDETGAVLKTLPHRFTLLEQENAGKSVALNRAMAQASGEFVWVCDDDDLLCEGAAATLLGLLDDARMGWAFGRYTRFREEDGQRVDIGPPHWPDLSQGSVLRHTLEDAFTMQNGALVRRDLYERVGPFDETMPRSLDYEMFVRLALAAPAAHTDAILFQQRKHPGARGPARLQHAADQSEDVWARWDRVIFERHRGTLSEELFASLFESANPSAARRAGLLQRASVFARHDLWSQAIEDWAAARAACDAPLHPLEWQICRRAMAGRHGFAGALSGDIGAALRSMGAQGPVARDIAASVLDGLTWRLRDAEVKNRSLARQLISHIDGPLGLAKLVARRARSKVIPRAEPFDLAEKSSPPLPAKSS